MTTMEEKGVVRHVRTQAGVRRFGQPIGSVIVRDRPLQNVQIVPGASDYEGWEVAKDSRGRRYYVGRDGGIWYATEGDDWDKIVAEAGSEEGIWKSLDELAGKAKGAAKKPARYGDAGYIPVRERNRRKPARGMTDEELVAELADLQEQVTSPTIQVSTIDIISRRMHSLSNEINKRRVKANVAKKPTRRVVVQGVEYEGGKPKARKSPKPPGGFKPGDGVSVMQGRYRRFATVADYGHMPKVGKVMVRWSGGGFSLIPAEELEKVS